MTTQRLESSRFRDIARDVSWVFSPKLVVIENEGDLLPDDVVAAVLEEEFSTTRIEASWQLHEESGLLTLSQRKANDGELPGEVTLPITPAGHIRVNLAGRQCNVTTAKKVSTPLD